MAELAAVQMERPVMVVGLRQRELTRRMRRRNREERHINDYGGILFVYAEHLVQLLMPSSLTL